MFKAIFDKTLIPAIKYINRRTNVEKSTRVLDEVSRRIAQSSADYVEERMTAAIIFQKREMLWDYVFGKSCLDGLILEFGVSEAKSINHFSKLVNQTVYGFDSFEGLKEDWAGSAYVKGHFSREGKLPLVSSNVQLVKGWFNETLPGFLLKEPGLIKIMHIDSDTYEAAKTVLDIIESRLISGSIIIFDEYFGYLGWKAGEYKAFQELVKRKKLRYLYLGFSENSVAVEIL
jgi:hypothetical protein